MIRNGTVVNLGQKKYVIRLEPYMETIPDLNNKNDCLNKDYDLTKIKKSPNIELPKYDDIAEIPENDNSDGITVDKTNKTKQDEISLSKPDKTNKKKTKRQPKKVKKSPLPLVYERNMKLLEDIEDLAEREELDDIVDFSNAEDYLNAKNIDLSDDEFKNLKNMMELLFDISDDIVKIDEGKLTKRKVKRPATKIKQLRASYGKIKAIFE